MNRRSDRALQRELKELEGVTGQAAARRRNHLRQTLKCRERRAKLIADLGGACDCCGSTHDLEFDHYPKRADWERRGVNQWVRQKRYEADAAAGNLRLLCSRCNGAAGGAVGNIDAIQNGVAKNGKPIPF